MRSFTRADGQYVLGRILAVSARPFLLLVATNYLVPEAAQGIAVVFLLVSLGMLAIAADVHRTFYTHRFAAEPTSDYHYFDVYAGSTVLVAALGSIIVFGGTWRFAGSLPIAAAAVLYFVAEKLQDEVLRYRLFESAFASWGRAVTVRALLQFLFLGVLLVLFRHQVPPWLAILGFALADLVVFVPHLPNGLTAKVVGMRSATLASLVRRSVRALYHSRLYWTMALLSAGIGYLDRILALVVDTSILPLFMLIVMCFSVVQLGTDFFFVSRHRRDFLQHRMTVRAAFLDRRFLMSLGGGLSISVIACAIVLLITKDGPAFPLVYIPFIALLQVAVTMTNIPREISYWIHPAKHIFRIDVAFWGAFGLVALLGWAYGWGLAHLLPLVGMCALGRLALHVLLARRRPDGSVVPSEEEWGEASVNVLP